MTPSYVWHDSFIHLTWLIQTCGVTHSNAFTWVISDLCYTYEWVMFPIYMSYVTNTCETCHVYARVMSHTWMRHVTHMKEWYHAHEWMMSHIWMSHVMSHIHSYVTFVCDMYMWHAYVTTHSYVITHSYMTFLRDNSFICDIQMWYSYVTTRSCMTFVCDIHMWH